ncbi:MAG: YggT family protein [Eggerthellaceae bacterium]|nr:YggT family protein [Eggerthellaceae bacterium]
MISSIIVSLANAYTVIIFVYVLMSWLPDTTNGVIGQVYRALGTLCEPYLGLFRRFIPPIGGMIDISPIVALLVLQFVVRLIIGIL